MWKCPACQTAIRMDGNGPHQNRVYRCSVCRLELVLDENLRELTVAPLPTAPPASETDSRNE
jgi:hypothetical protein